MIGSVVEAAEAVDRSGARFTTLLRSGLDGDQRLRTSTWTIGDLGRHVASGVEAYARMAEGAPSPYTDLDDRAATNRARLEAVPTLNLQRLADIIDAGRALAVDRLRMQPADAAIAWHGGVTMPVRAALGAMAGEFLIHGLDLARTVGVHWPIDRADVLPVIDMFIAAGPHLIDTGAIRSLRATVEIRFRGYCDSTFAFQDGELAVTPGRSRRADVRMSVDAVRFVILGYERAGLLRTVASCGVVAWGRRPLVALRFAGYFQSP